MTNPGSRAGMTLPKCADDYHRPKRKYDRYPTPPVNVTTTPGQRARRTVIQDPYSGPTTNQD